MLSHKSIGILGGGISGLSTAWYLSYLLHPSTKITILESSNRLGGLLSTKKIDLSQGTIYFEEGPRSLRPTGVSGYITLNMVKKLNLIDEMILIPKNSPLIKNKFIYFQNQLNALPNSLLSLFLPKTSLFRSLLWAIICEPFKQTRNKNITDESISSFISRRFNTSVSKNLASALIHGIYSGDIDDLSARSVLPYFWKYEELYGSILKGILFDSISLNKNKENVKSSIEKESKDIIAKTKNTYIYSFKNGLNTLSNTISNDLFSKNNVHIYFNSKVQSLEFKNIFKVKTNTSDFFFDHLISALPIQVITEIFNPFKKLTKSFSNNTVLVVNLFFDNKNLLPIKGFGYLIPKSVSEKENPENALGVIFDSNSFPELDTYKGTKITVMIGGSLWKYKTTFPKENEFAELAQNVISRHLGIKDTPIIINYKLQKECIPQYNVGHYKDLQSIHNYLYNTYQGRFSVVGNFYGGIGVSDCIKNAYFLTKRLKERGRATGLESIELN
ncbi:protoporphyrinogen oxidase [Pneumocystis jirovecii RU7]|uniref:Protoporphyrinogen oxidase n=1 Tax=Pneumocystis jirovecii (strain RU7) TaxID=1408657 RepID=A0A0W4ZPY5_PNEJ7|nr:protoporphyrinogen oxidase [Pneumocystis jirovecii RU7]KTW30431.1 protoporphyrinogen oxidase [Pneumocystis jirovecii RU7]